MISALYIACFFPIVFVAITTALVPEMNVGGALENLMTLVFTLLFLLETTNASLNFYIYNTMSSNFKTVLRSMFGMGRDVQRVG